MRKFVLLTMALTALAMPAMAADMPTKAPPAPVATAYPYSVAGLYWGITTYASQTTLNVNAPGADSGAMAVVGGSLGGVIGYSMPINKGANFAAFELSAAGQNIGGSSTQAV